LDARPTEVGRYVTRPTEVGRYGTCATYYNPRVAKKRPSKSPSLFDLDSTLTVATRPAAGGGGGGHEAVALHEAAQSRYLNYALSVITSRALPDVRDGLKPVQRRILYTMWQQNLTADARHRKSAKVVGDVMGNYHPHGDAALYETLVRMAQPFSLRYPLIDGSGNFGSLDGDSAAAMRYTECRLARASDELLTEIDQDTVTFRPNYDGTRDEPVVLPARIPNLLINGATGIAVGMATNIPPHNLGEVSTALVKLIDANLELSSAELSKYIKGPDFPTGGQIVNTPQEIRDIYKTGAGTIRLRATWQSGPFTRSGQTIYITSIPYTLNKAALVERIAEIALSRKLPHLLDVKDLSTDDVRIALELKKDAEPRMVMAYLYKHTPLQSTFPVNLTCLVPTENPLVSKPDRLGLHDILWHFLHFRLDVVRARLKHELEALKARIHILEGFAVVFDALDEILKIVRKSEGKQDAAAKIMKRFDLDAEQTDAILELKIYRLARLEILVIQEELAAKKKRAKDIGSLLKRETDLWKIVRSEIEEVQKKYGDPKANPRRSEIVGAVKEDEYTADDFIVEEDNVVVVTRDGWVKRQKEIKDVGSTRVREGDAVAAIVPGSTRATAVFFTNFGVAYTARIADMPASTGYGEPVQSLFKFKDGEKVVAALSLDPRVIGDIAPRAGAKAKAGGGDEAPPPVHALAVTSDGYSLRFSLQPLIEPSTRAGRRFARVAEGAEVVGVARVTGVETIIAATRQARAMLCKADEVNFLSGPGRGVILIKVQKTDDRVLGFIASTGDRDLLTVETTRGAEQTVSTAKYGVTGRGGKGRELLQRGEFVRVISKPPEG
jgi:DNA gyrase subunit A